MNNVTDEILAELRKTPFPFETRYIIHRACQRLITLEHMVEHEKLKTGRRPWRVGDVIRNHTFNGLKGEYVVREIRTDPAEVRCDALGIDTIHTVVIRPPADQYWSIVTPIPPVMKNGEIWVHVDEPSVSWIVADEGMLTLVSKNGTSRVIGRSQMGKWFKKEEPKLDTSRIEMLAEAVKRVRQELADAITAKKQAAALESRKVLALEAVEREYRQACDWITR